MNTRRDNLFQRLYRQFPVMLSASEASQSDKKRFFASLRMTDDVALYRKPPLQSFNCVTPMK